MSSDWFADVLDFNRKFGAHIGCTPSIPPLAILILKLKLCHEELYELVDAMSKDRSPAGVADACADLIYVTLGAAQACGIDLRPVWDAVHASNMAKVGGGEREDGKILKPPGWQRPDFQGILAKQPPLGVL